MFGLKDTRTGKRLITLEDIDKDQVILRFERRFIDHPTRTSMQVDKDKHQAAHDPEAYENFIDHSCDPNCYIDFNCVALRARRPIRKGESLTYNYLTTEWDMGEGFECRCNSRRCYGGIRGFKHLSKKRREKLRPFLSAYLRKRID